MKRKIKFRRPYFNNYTNKFEYFDYWGTYIEKDGIIIEFKSPLQSNHTYGGDDQQYIGHKDKNGKEIFEGDIWLMNGIESQPMIVCFDDNTASFCSKSKWGGSEYSRREDGYSYWNIIGSEIIGNVNENPELLNDNN